MAKILHLTTMTNTWEQYQVAVEETRQEELFNLFLTPEYFTKLNQGIQEGWIVVLGVA